MKKRIYILILVCMFFYINNAYAQIEIDKKSAEIVLKSNGFDVNKLTQIKYLTKIRNIRFEVWVLGQCGLLEKDFPSIEKMNEIKNTSTLRFALDYPDHLTGAIRIAKFNNFDESKLAWADSAPLNPPYLDTLISGEQIEGAKIITSVKLGCVVWIYLFYKNWLCEARFSTGGRQMTDKEKDIADNTIKIFKKIIDEI